MAFVLLLAAGIAWMRTAQAPSGLVQGAWSATGSMAVNRGYHTATLLPDGRVLVVGGSQRFLDLSSAELYDPRTGTWSSAGSLPTPSWGHTATLLQNGKVLVVGGSQADGFHLGSNSSAELYDPLTNSWAQIASMHTPRSFHTATLLPDGRVLVVGGDEAFNDVSGRVLASAELYDPATNGWSPAPSMSTARAKHDAILLANGQVLVLGGTGGVNSGESSNSLRTAEIYDPTTRTWSPAASMHYARMQPTALLLPDDRVLVVGDQGSNEQTAETFDPTSDQWSTIASPAVGRAEAVAVRLPSGNVLVAGGLGQTRVQSFDWRSDAWSDMGEQTRIRAAATATVLQDGKVLIAGGYGALGLPWASAEVYDPRGRSAVGGRAARSAPAPFTASVLVLGISTLLLGLALSVRRRRLVRQSHDGEMWID
jgi:N-acetylneuraminic acid mutarotase